MMNASKPRPENYETWEEYEFACERYQAALEEYADAYHEKKMNRRNYGL